MTAQIHWTAFLRVKNSQAADKLVVRLHEALGHELQVTDLSPYWKDDALFRCAFTTSLASAAGPEALSVGLRQAGSLAPSWEIGNLTEPDRLWGWARKGVVIAGIDAVGFEFGARQESE